MSSYLSPQFKYMIFTYSFEAIFQVCQDFSYQDINKTLFAMLMIKCNLKHGCFNKPVETQNWPVESCKSGSFLSVLHFQSNQKENPSFKVSEHSFQGPMPISPLLLSHLCFGVRFLQESRLTIEEFILAFWPRCVLLPRRRGSLKTRLKKWFLFFYLKEIQSLDFIIICPLRIDIKSLLSTLF